MMTLKEIEENARTLMNLHPANRLGRNFINQFNKWQDNEEELYKNYKGGSIYDPTTNTYSSNPNYHSSAFGEAKGANLVNAPYLGATPFKDSDNVLARFVDYGVGAHQTAIGNTINAAYQLAQEGTRAVQDKGWKGLISTDWLKNAWADTVEEGNAFNKARFAANIPTTPQTLWDYANSVDDANVVQPKLNFLNQPITQPVTQPTGTSDAALAQIQANIAAAKAKSTVQPTVNNVSPGGGNSRRQTTQSTAPVFKSYGPPNRQRY